MLITIASSQRFLTEALHSKNGLHSWAGRLSSRVRHSQLGVWIASLEQRDWSEYVYKEGERAEMSSAE